MAKKRNSRAAQVAYAVDWFLHQHEDVRRKALSELFDFAILGEWIGVWDEDDREELGDAPYFRTSGEPLGECDGEAVD